MDPERRGVLSNAENVLDLRVISGWLRAAENVLDFRPVLILFDASGSC